MAQNGLKGLEWQEITGNYWTWLELDRMAGYGLIYLEMAKNGWKWLEMARNGWNGWI